MNPKLDWELISEISSLLCDMDHKNIIDISTEELALLLESIYRQVTRCWDKGDKKDPLNWDFILTQAYNDIGWTESKPSKRVIGLFQSNFIV
jgi:hypothetical protein